MTEESNAKLLQAYKYATEADQDGIADLLGDVILELMDSEKPNTKWRSCERPTNARGSGTN